MKSIFLKNGFLFVFPFWGANQLYPLISPPHSQECDLSVSSWLLISVLISYVSSTLKKQLLSTSSMAWTVHGLISCSLGWIIHAVDHRSWGFLLQHSALRSLVGYMPLARILLLFKGAVCKSLFTTFLKLNAHSQTCMWLLLPRGLVFKCLSSLS